MVKEVSNQREFCERLLTTGSVTLESTAAFEQENRHNIVSDTTANLQHTTSSTIVVLQYLNVPVSWMPWQLAQELKQRRIYACQKLLSGFETESEGFPVNNC